MPTSRYPHPNDCNCGACYGVWYEHNITSSPRPSYKCACAGCIKREFADFRHPKPINDAWPVGHPSRHPQERASETMSQIFMCDRCDSMMTGHAAGKMDLQRFPNDEWKNLTICPGCVTDVLTFLTEDVMTSRERAYREPWQDSSDDTDNGTIVTTKGLRKALRELMAGEDDQEN